MTPVLPVPLAGQSGMAALAALTGHPGAAALAALAWAGLACLLPMLPVQRQHGAIWVLIVIGVPVLGWLTYLCGPGFGVLFLALGLSLLVWPPVEALRRRRATAARAHTPGELH